MHMLGLLDTGWVFYAHEKSAFSSNCFIFSRFRNNFIIILIKVEFPVIVCMFFFLTLSERVPDRPQQNQQCCTRRDSAYFRQKVEQ
jgi:hypothetical protein